MDNKGCCMMPAGDKGGAPQNKKGDCDASACCLQTLLLGALAGGVAMFLWYAASWMLLPAHKNTLLRFGDEKAVAEALMKNTAGSGVYVLPSMAHQKMPRPEGVKQTGKAIPKAPTAKKPAKAEKPAPAKQSAAAKAGGKPPGAMAAMPRMEPARPFAFVSVYANGVDRDIKPLLVKHFVLCFFAALALTALLKKLGGCGCPVMFSAKLGVLVALLHYVPDMIWFRFPVNYSLVGMGDDVIAMMLAGAVIGKGVLKCGPCMTTGSCTGKSEAACTDKKKK